MFNYKNLLSKLHKDNEQVIESEIFTATNYLIKNHHICIMTANNGVLAVDINRIDDFISELKEIKDNYRDLNLKCVREVG